MTEDIRNQAHVPWYSVECYLFFHPRTARIHRPVSLAYRPPSPSDDKVRAVYNKIWEAVIKHIESLPNFRFSLDSGNIVYTRIKPKNRFNDFPKLVLYGDHEPTMYFLEQEIDHFLAENERMINRKSDLPPMYFNSNFYKHCHCREAYCRRKEMKRDEHLQTANSFAILPTPEIFDTFEPRHYWTYA